MKKVTDFIHIGLSHLVIRKKIAALLGLLSLIFTTPAVHASEVGISLLKGDESKTQGFSFSFADKFSRGSQFYWELSYNKLNDVKVDWNKRSLYFSVDTIEAMVSYRQRIKSYNAFTKNLTLEYQAGVLVALTENKFFWPELNETKFFSETGDVNGLLGFTVHYKLGKSTAIKLGIKHIPSFSEFGSHSTVHLGFTYKFGTRYSY
ncbi:MAG: hypothetical protein ACI9LM_002698 [Alteromonadaceae bacterium]|jgi:hypothetical protein